MSIIIRFFFVGKPKVSAEKGWSDFWQTSPVKKRASTTGGKGSIHLPKALILADMTGEEKTLFGEFYFFLWEADCFALKNIHSLDGSV